MSETEFANGIENETASKVSEKRVDVVAKVEELVARYSCGTRVEASRNPRVADGRIRRAG